MGGKPPLPIFDAEDLDVVRHRSMLSMKALARRGREHRLGHLRIVTANACRATRIRSQLWHNLVAYPSVSSRYQDRRRVNAAKQPGSNRLEPLGGLLRLGRLRSRPPRRILQQPPERSNELRARAR